MDCLGIRVSALRVLVKGTMAVTKRFAREPILACWFVSLVCLTSFSEAQREPADSTQTRPAALIGDWGGPHLAMSVTGKGASLEFDCGRGQIDEPLRRDARGRFSVRGTYVQGHAGPVRAGEVPNSQAALYTGTIKGTQMTIGLRLLDSDQQIGTFTLRRGQPARLFKCR